MRPTVPKNFVNELAKFTSPHLRAHASNPIAWQSWTPATFELARTLKRPLFVSIGFDSCHWCHVLNRTEFSRAEIGDILNKNFVPVKVDREERPDVDAVYTLWLQTNSGGRSGWPLNVFLEPQNLQAWFGGTSWSEETVGISFSEVLVAAVREWNTRQQDCYKVAENSFNSLKKLVSSKTASPVPLNLKELASNIVATCAVEPHEGPRFILPGMLEAFGSGQFGKRNKEEALSALKQVARGGIRDMINGGLHRYSVSPDFLIPHFEKSLVDQALTLQACLPFDDVEIKSLAHDTADFLLYGPLVSPERRKGWFSTVDADYNGKEGAYYTWTASQFRDALASLGMIERDMAEYYFGVTEKGNFEGSNILSESVSTADVAKTFGRSNVGDVIRTIVKAKELLRQARPMPPSVDKKRLIGSNAAAAGALARASRVLGRPVMLERATQVCSSIWDDYALHSRLNHLFDDAGIPAMADDYAYAIQAFLDLHDITGDPQWLSRARKLQDDQTSELADPCGGFWLSTAPELPFRPKSGFDSAEPSYQGISLRNLKRLGRDNEASQILNAYSLDIKAQPLAYLTLLYNALL